MPEFLKCDAPGCDHVEDVEAISRDLIGKACPKCGADLLTEADCEAWLAMVQPGIELAKALGLFVDRPPTEADQALVRVHLHGNDFSLKTIPVGESASAAPKPEGGSNA